MESSRRLGKKGVDRAEKYLRSWQSQLTLHLFHINLRCDYVATDGEVAARGTSDPALVGDCDSELDSTQRRLPIQGVRLRCGFWIRSPDLDRLVGLPSNQS